MSDEHKRVIGDRPGDVDREWRIFRESWWPSPGCEAPLLRAMEHQAYTIAGGVFSHPRPDVVNESLTRAWKSLGKFRGESRFSTWFHRIVLNVCKAHGAKETLQRKREVPLADIDLKNLCYGGNWWKFDEAILILSKEERLFLYDKLLPLPDAEVATKWGLSLSGVRGRWRRIKKKIQVALG